MVVKLQTKKVRRKMALKGIDISYCQHNVDFVTAKKSGISAAIIRNGYFGKTDTEWSNHVSRALYAGLDVGTYTYIWSENPEQAVKEAEQTVQRLEKYKGRINYPVFADMEDKKYLTSRFNKSSRTKILLSFLETINKSGYYPGVYTNPSWLETYLDKSKILGQYDIWLAAYTHDPNKPTKYDYGQTMWQWGMGIVPGAGEVDSDLIYVNYPDIIRKAKKNFLEHYKAVTLAFDAAIRSEPSVSGKKLGVLSAGTKCAIVEGTETVDKLSKYTYIKLAGSKEQWIVKSAISGGV